LIYIKTPEEIKIMREGGIILAKILKELEKAVKPGVTTDDIDKLASELISFYKTKPAFLGFNDFPAVSCISVNEEVVHCVPSNRVIRAGDLVSVDMGLIYKGFNLDSAVTVVALKDGQSYGDWASANPGKHQLLETTQKALKKGISKVVTGVRVGVISSTIQQVVENNGLVIVKELTGHGIGRGLHEEPQIPNFGQPKSGVELEEGMVVALEPIVSMGDWQLKDHKDGFGYLTKDSSMAAHFEHTIAVTKKGAVILTQE